MIKQNLSGNTVQQINSIIVGDDKPQITSTLEKSVGAVGEYVAKRLSIYPQATPTKANRVTMSLYVDNNGQSQRVSMQQIKEMGTKVIIADDTTNIDNLDIGDLIISKE